MIYKPSYRCVRHFLWFNNIYLQFGVSMVFQLSVFSGFIALHRSALQLNLSFLFFMECFLIWSNFLLLFKQLFIIFFYYFVVIMFCCIISRYWNSQLSYLTYSCKIKFYYNQNKCLCLQISNCSVIFINKINLFECLHSFSLILLYKLEIFKTNF